jgi:hypothetical protein
MRSLILIAQCSAGAFRRPRCLFVWDIFTEGRAKGIMWTDKTEGGGTELMVWGCVHRFFGCVN